MNTERNDLARRAAVHAALGDPARLAIADQLVLGDKSPLELQTELGMASNLVAHHLRVLEKAGVISRHRSEADRRRSYLKLRRRAFGGLLPGASIAVPRVVFVCTANTARSQLADALWRTVSPVPSASAGTHPADRIADETFELMRRHGMKPPELSPHSLNSVLGPRDLVITVCDRAHEELGAEGLHWSVPDPVPEGTPDAFEHAYKLLAERIDELAPRVTAA
ncbi:MAG: helix-turn-helix domain-containing protein [Microbacteriaceae bacterium]|nr:helix-turn-helix domain-containing protein [Microbacteriaceae bacterium]